MLYQTVFVDKLVLWEDIFWNLFFKTTHYVSSHRRF